DWPSVGDANFGIFSSPAIGVAVADSQCLNNGIASANGWAGATILRDPQVADAKDWPPRVTSRMARSTAANSSCAQVPPAGNHPIGRSSSRAAPTTGQRVLALS